MKSRLFYSVVGALVGLAVGCAIYVGYLGRRWDAALPVVAFVLAGLNIALFWRVGFRTSIRGFFASYQLDEKEATVSEQVRNFSKGFLELIRNLGVVAAIEFVAVKADSRTLSIVAAVGMIAIASTIGTYFTNRRFVGFDEVKSPALRHTLNFSYTALPGLIAYMLISAGIRYVVDEIVRSQGLLH